MEGREVRDEMGSKRAEGRSNREGTGDKGRERGDVRGKRREEKGGV